MTESLGIIEEAKNTINDVKEAALETVQNATETIKTVLGETKMENVAAVFFEKASDERTEELMDTADEAYDEAKITGRKGEEAKNAAEKTVQSAKDRYTVFKGEEVKTSQDKGNIQMSRISTFEKEAPMVAQRVTTVLESVLEPASTAKVIPTVCSNLKKIIK